jgi:pyruvate/2-oxoglutarate dehydrogenase complex dihydrolipoamide acyltransferase (E2) component
MEGLFMLLLGPQEKLREIVQRRLRHPTLGALPALAGADDPGVDELLQVMGNGGLSNTQPLAQFPDAKPGTFLGVAAAPFAAGGQAEKNRQAMRMRESFECRGKFLDAHKSIYIDISILSKKFNLSSHGGGSTKRIRATFSGDVFSVRGVLSGVIFLRRERHAGLGDAPRGAILAGIASRFFFMRATFLAALLACTGPVRGGDPAPSPATATLGAEPSTVSPPAPALAPPAPPVAASGSATQPTLAQPPTEQPVPAAQSPDASAAPPPAQASGDSSHHDDGGDHQAHDDGQPNREQQREQAREQQQAQDAANAQAQADAQAQSADTTASSPPTDDNAGSSTSIPWSTPSPGVQRRHYTMDDLINAPDPSDSNHHTMDELL